MITFHLTRQEAAHIYGGWMSDMKLIAETRMINNAGSDSRYLNAMMICSLLDDIEILLEKRLIDRKKTNFKITLSYAHAVAFYFHIFTKPIPTAFVWENRLRQHLCDEIHQQLFSMRPPVHENIPITIEDFYADFIE